MTVAALALLPGGDHARIILIGGDDLVAGFQLHAELDNLERLAGVARDGDLFGVAAEHAGQAAAHGFDAGVEHVPHVVGRVQVLHLEIAHLGVHHDFRRGRDAAVIQVDHVAIDREGVADVQPEVFVAGDRIGGASGDGGDGVLRAGEGNGLSGGQEGSGGTKKSASVHSECYINFADVR